MMFNNVPLSHQLIDLSDDEIEPIEKSQKTLRLKQQTYDVIDIDCLSSSDESHHKLDSKFKSGPSNSSEAEKIFKEAEDMRRILDVPHSNKSSEKEKFRSLTKIQEKKQEAEKKRALRQQASKARHEAVEKDKMLKKSVNEIRRNEKPGEVHKTMTVCIDSNINEKEELGAYLVAEEIKYEIGSNLLPKSFGFKRETMYQAMGNDLKLQKLSKWEEEDQILILLETDDIVPKLYYQIHESDPATGTFTEKINLITFVKSIQESVTGKSVTLILYGMEKYFKKMKKYNQNEFRGRVVNSTKQKKCGTMNQLPIISNIEFQSSMVELQLHTQTSYRVIDSVDQLGKLLVNYTKAIAEAPFKKQRKAEGFDWFASTDSAGSVRVDKDGQGLGALWMEQLQLFGNVGIDAARAIYKFYPSPKLLLKAYSECETSEEGMNLLREIDVRFGVGPLTQERKLGPELSRKIYRFFISTNPEQCLGAL